MRQADAAPPQRLGRAVAALCAVQFMVVLDSTVTTVAAESIRDDLAAPDSALPYVFSLYATAFGGLLLLAGRAGDLYGHRRMFPAGTVTFTAASLLCALAPVMPVLLVGRSVQGAGAAFASAAAFAGPAAAPARRRVRRVEAWRHLPGEDGAGPRAGDGRARGNRVPDVAVPLSGAVAGA